VLLQWNLASRIRNEKAQFAFTYVFPNGRNVAAVITRPYPMYTEMYNVFIAQTRMMGKLIVWFPCYPLPDFSAS
jgi:hypothetical protein